MIQPLPTVNQRARVSTLASGSLLIEVGPKRFIVEAESAGFLSEVLDALSNSPSIADLVEALGSQDVEVSAAIATLLSIGLVVDQNSAREAEIEWHGDSDLADLARGAWSELSIWCPPSIFWVDSAPGSSEYDEIIRRTSGDKRVVFLELAPDRIVIGPSKLNAEDACAMCHSLRQWGNAEALGVWEAHEAAGRWNPYVIEKEAKLLPTLWAIVAQADGAIPPNLQYVWTRGSAIDVRPVLPVPGCPTCSPGRRVP